MQAQKIELEAWKWEQEAGLTAKAEAQQQELAAIQEQRRGLQQQAAKQAQLQQELQALQAKYGEAEARAGALQEEEQRLASQRAEVWPIHQPVRLCCCTFADVP